MKSKRQERIIDIITQESIETQEELIEKLAAAGFNVTQATISRDIRDLKISKVATGHGTYKYTATKREELSLNIRMNPALIGSIKKIDSANNLVVFKTFPGLAQAVAAGIDNTDMPSCLGCIAGDDTILIVFADNESAEEFKKEFTSYVNLS